MRIVCLLALFVAALFLFTGCVAGPQDGNWESQGGLQNRTRGGMGNLTEEERQLMMDGRMQAASGACDGKKEGEACSLAMQSPRGNVMVDGTCENRDGGLFCNAGTPRMQGGWNRALGAQAQE